MLENISLNNFDYLAIIFIIWQAYKGYKRGFEDIIYGILKYIIVIIGLYIGNKYIWDILAKSPFFIKAANTVNTKTAEFFMQFEPKDEFSA